MTQDELEIKILKREEDRIFIEVRFGTKIYRGYIEFNENALNNRIKGRKSKRKLVYNKLEKRIEKQIYKANNKKIVQALRSSLKPYLSSSYKSNVEFQSEISEKLVGKTLSRKALYDSVHKNLIRNNRVTLKLTESETGDILPPIIP